MSKWFLRSKTLWINGLAAGGLVMAAQNTAADQVNNIALALIAPAGNGLLRFVTTEAVGRFGKSILRSKTIWLNLAFVAGAGLAVAGGQTELGVALGGLALANMWLRFVTRSGVTVFPHPGRR
jgi:hypothetical protein